MLNSADEAGDLRVRATVSPVASSSAEFSSAPQNSYYSSRVGVNVRVRLNFWRL